MVNEVVWPIENIPDRDLVFMRAHEAYFRNGNLMPGAFTPKQGPGLSVDWEKYSTKEQTRQRAKNAMKNAVVALLVGGIRGIGGLDVKHKPEPQNRAHSEVDLPTNHEELTEIRIALLRLAGNPVIPIHSA